MKIKRSLYIQVDKVSSKDGPLVLLYLDGHGTVRTAGWFAYQICFSILVLLDENFSVYVYNSYP